MHDAPLALGLPCHRVVNSIGRTVPGWHQQAILLMSEGVRIKANACPATATRASRRVMMVCLLNKMLTFGHLQTSMHGSLLIAFFIVRFDLFYT